jgi:hypothetical protein
VNADERLRELINGGPYEPYRWIIMVRLAVEADDAGLVDEDPERIGDWVGSVEAGEHALGHLLNDGWITETHDMRWDIGQALRQGRTAPEPDY